MQLRILLLFFLVALLSCCSAREGDSRRIPEETFVRLYADMLIEREERVLRGTGDAQTAATDSLYQSYGVTAPDVEHTLYQYQSDLAAWKEFHVKVTKRLEILQEEMASKRLRRNVP